MTTPPAKPAAYHSVKPATDGWDASDGKPVPNPGADLLDAVETYLRRFVAFPTDAAAIATTLWAAHAHAIEAAESSPRLAFLSPEPGSGKSRALEALSPLVPNPMHAVNATPAALFRAVSDLDERPTILFDEVDTVFGPKARDNEEVRGFLNAGHRRGAVAYRCVGEGTRQTVVAFPAFAAVALAGLHDLPDTIASRAVIIHMRRRARHEVVEPFRFRKHEPAGFALRSRLAGWVRGIGSALGSAEPDMPAGVEDRPADVWEPLLAIADCAGGAWPRRARQACVRLTTEERDVEPSLGVRLLSDLRDMWAQHPDATGLHTETLLESLHAIDDAPWSDLRGRPLDARGLARLLRQYGITRASVRHGSRSAKGYRREDLADAWSRYLPPGPLPETGHAGHAVTSPHESVPTEGSPTNPQQVTAPSTGHAHTPNARGETTQRDPVTDVTHSQPGEEKCPHGMVGGTLPDLFVGGAAACPLCRIGAA